MALKEHILQILPYLATLSTLIPLVVGFICIKHVNNEMRWIFFLVIASILAELAIIIAPYITYSNIIYVNIYQFTETILITLFYLAITPVKFWRYLMLCACIGISVWSLIYILGSQRNQLNDIAFTIESVFVIIYSLLGFYFLLKKLQNTNIWDIPLFWVNSAFLLFFGGNIFLHAFNNYLLKHALYNFYELWGMIHSSLNIIFYILIAVAFWKTRNYRA